MTTTMRSLTDIEAFILAMFDEGLEPHAEDVAQAYVDHRASQNEYGKDNHKLSAMEIDYTEARNRAAQLLGTEAH